MSELKYFKIQFWPEECGFISSFTGSRDDEMLGFHSTTPLSIGP